MKEDRQILFLYSDSRAFQAFTSNRFAKFQLNKLQNFAYIFTRFIGDHFVESEKYFQKHYETREKQFGKRIVPVYVRKT